MKKDILERLETEVKACKRYAENSIKKIKRRQDWSSHQPSRHSRNSKEMCRPSS